MRDFFNKDLKGKIERTVEFVKKDFFAGNRFTSFTDPSYHHRRKESRKISREFIRLAWSTSILSHIDTPG